MTDRAPEGRKLNDGAEPMPPWEHVVGRIATAQTYWLGTLHPTGRPQARPVLAVWVDGTLHTTSSPTAQKSRNLAADDRCTLSALCDDLDISLEGVATRITDHEVMERVAEAYRAKYEWPVTVEGSGFEAPYAAPTAGPGPYEVYRIEATTVYAFQNSARFGPSRWDVVPEA